MRLILTKHAETIENVQGVHQGHLPGRVSELGRKQIERVAERLKNEKIDFIYSSDLARTADTTKGIAKYHPNTPIKYLKELRERSFGYLEGKRHKDIMENEKDFKALMTEAKGGETQQELYDRAKKFLHEIIPKHKGKTILIAAHDGFNKALLAVATGAPSEEMYNLPPIGPTSMTIVEVKENKKHEIKLFNCMKHLV